MTRIKTVTVEGLGPNERILLLSGDLADLAANLPDVPGATQYLVTFGAFGDAATVLIDLTPAEAALLSLIGERVDADGRVDAHLTVEADPGPQPSYMPVTTIHRTLGLTP